MKKMMGLFSILFFLFLGNVANAETDLLNLSNYTEGTRVPYGENMVVVQDEETAEKWITNTKDSKGKLNIPINLSSDSFEITLEVHDIYYGNTGGFFLIADEVQFKFNIWFRPYATTYLDGSKKSPSVWQDDGKNAVKISVNGGVGKLYVNDVFVQKITLNEDKQNITYTNLMVTSISDGYTIYSLKIKGASDVAIVDSGSSSTSSCTTNIAPAPTGDCTADYTNGQLRVPCVAVSDPFGGKTIYDIKMNQQTGSFTFDLDMGSVKPK